MGDTGRATGRQLVVAIAALASLLWVVPSPAGAQEADATTPPTPEGLTVVYVRGGQATEVVFTGEESTPAGFSRAANAEVDPLAARHGAAGLRVSSTDAPGFVRWDVAEADIGHNYVSAQFWVRLESRAEGQSVDLFTVTNAQGERNFDIFVAAGSDRFKWDIYREAAGEGRVVNPGQWYFVEVQLSYSGTIHWAEVRIDGEDWGRIESPGVDTAVQSVTVGAATSKTHTQAYDDLVVHLGHVPLTSGPAAQGEPQVALRWHPPRSESVEAGAQVEQFEVWRNDTWYDWVSGDATSYLDPLPVSGASYRVRAIGQAGGVSGWSAEASVPVVGVAAEAVVEEPAAGAPHDGGVLDDSELAGWQGRFDARVLAWVDAMTRWWVGSPS